MHGRRSMVLGFMMAIIGWLCPLLAGTVAAAAAPQYTPQGEMRWALYVTISPAWFDPAQVAVAGLTPFWICYALHDALVKPMPGNPKAPSPAEQQYYVYLSSQVVTASWQPYLKHYAPNLNSDFGSRVAALWLDR